MKRIFFFILVAMSMMLQVTACNKSDDNFNSEDQKKDETPIDGNHKNLVVYFSAQGHTQAVAEEIAKQMGADILRLEAAEPYAANPYNDSQRIQDEAYKDLRPAVANMPTAEYMDQYDRIFVGSPIWWHQPAMVVCTFLEAFDLSGKTIVPFFTYGATTYLNEAMHKIYKSTPNSQHVPATLPEDLNPDDITTPGPADDAGIDMPGSAHGVADWLKKLGLTATETSIHHVNNNDAAPFELRRMGNNLLQVKLFNGMLSNLMEIRRTDGTLLHQQKNATSYVVQLPFHSVYLISVYNQQTGKRYSQKIAM